MFLTVVNQGNDLVESFNAINRYTRLADLRIIGGGDVGFDFVGRHSRRSSSMVLYYYMEQVGWDGRPRPATSRPAVNNEKWPESVPAQNDTFLGEPYLGPLG